MCFNSICPIKFEGDYCDNWPLYENMDSTTAESLHKRVDFDPGWEPIWIYQCKSRIEIAISNKKSNKKRVKLQKEIVSLFFFQRNNMQDAFLLLGDHLLYAWFRLHQLYLLLFVESNWSDRVRQNIHLNSGDSVWWYFCWLYDRWDWYSWFFFILTIKLCDTV